MKTKVRIADNNGKEYGYQAEYIMIDVIDDYTIIHHGMAEAIDKKDIPNARRRAIYAYRKMMDL